MALCQAVILMIRQIRHPIRIDARGRLMPGIGESLGNSRHWKSREQAHAAVTQRLLLELDQSTDRIIVKIARWHFGIAIDLTSQKPSYISAIFAKQCARFVFGMALEKNAQTIAVLNEDVRSGVGGSV
jgi:hypothetical protein